MIPTAMTAAELVRTLGGRWTGSYGNVRCPAHDDHEPSLTVRAGETGVLVYCQAGCEQHAVIAALRTRGLWPEAARGNSSPNLEIGARPADFHREHMSESAATTRDLHDSAERGVIAIGGERDR